MFKIKAQHVSVDIPVQGRTGGKKLKRGAREFTLKDRITHFRGRSVVRALDNVSFEAAAGDGIGIIGRNGSGKSTLLRVLAGFYVPTEGYAEIAGKISTLFSNNIGLEKDASGLENIFFAFRLLGFDTRQTNALLPEIVEFCDLGDFINMPFRTYSAGMKTRLGFAIATSVNSDILLVDEIFGAGDRQFRNKAKERISRLFENTGILLMANHAEAVIKQYCNKVLWLDNGRVYRFGPIDEVLAEFEEIKNNTPHVKKALPGEKSGK